MIELPTTPGKLRGIRACANAQGIIAAIAMDQRNALRKDMEAQRPGSGTPEALTTFKTSVARVLSKEASAILLDPEYGLPALANRAPNAGALLAYEQTGYDSSVRGRLPDLLPYWSARRLVEAGANAIKLLLYFNPFDEAAINDIKYALVERVGDECRALDVPFFLEPLVYDDRYNGLEFARLKPRYISALLEIFSQPRYGVDVFKIEVPINATYQAGSRSWQGGESAYNREDALEQLRMTAGATRKPFIYLSGGVSDSVFRENLELAAEAGVPFCGVLCGRATWKGGIEPFALHGTEALEEWLQDQGIRNLVALNETLAQCARPLPLR